MIASIDEELAMVNPVSDATVHRLTGPGARESLLAAVLGRDDSAPATRGLSQPVVTLAGRRRGGRLTGAPVLVAASVAAVVLLTVVGLQVGDRPDRGVLPVAAPEPGAPDTCADLDVASPGVQVRDERADRTFCVQVALEDRARGEAPIAWSAVSLADGDPSVQVSFPLDPVPPPAADAVLVLGGTSDAFPAEVSAPDGDMLSTHQVFGLAGSDVTGIDLLLPDGTVVPASLNDGVWGTWWPADDGGPDDSQVRITTTVGTATSTIDSVRLTNTAQAPPYAREDPLTRFRQGS